MDGAEAGLLNEKCRKFFIPYFVFLSLQKNADSVKYEVRYQRTDEPFVQDYRVPEVSSNQG